MFWAIAIIVAIYIPGVDSSPCVSICIESGLISELSNIQPSSSDERLEYYTELLSAFPTSSISSITIYLDIETLSRSRIDDVIDTLTTYTRLKNLFETNGHTVKLDNHPSDAPCIDRLSPC